ncbi:DUF1642 domain-containing protein [Enterococcus mundtii]
MNKQELIEELARHASCLEDFRGITGHCDGKYEAYEIAIELAKQLDEPQKPVVPHFVAESIEKIRSQVIGYHFESGARFLLLIGNDFHFAQEGLLTAEFRRWLEKDGNEVKLSNAIDYGYEVEQEPLYMVPLLTDKKGNKKILVERRGEYDIIWDYENECDWHELLTEEQIKSVNPDYWKLAVLYEPSEEVMK